MQHPSISFPAIHAHGGSQTHSFETLCCELARREWPHPSTYRRIHGAGGDGGVECLAILPNGTVIGLQAKFVFDIDGLLKQAGESLQTALSVHPTLTTYIVCFPFDLTGKTKRKGKSQTEKFDEWVTDAVAQAKAAGKTLQIEAWPAAKLQSLLLTHDVSGGMREFFFGSLVLHQQWFTDHIASTTRSAGPRYTPSLNVRTNLWDWFASFGDVEHWRRRLAELRKECRDALRHYETNITHGGSGGMVPPWPAALAQLGRTGLDTCKQLLATIDEVSATPSSGRYDDVLKSLNESDRLLADLDAQLTADFKAQHGNDSDTESFRRFQREYMVSFPAGNVDAVRETRSAFNAVRDWLTSPSGALFCRAVFVLSGAGGSGKTHGICDVATRRLSAGALTCVVFGHQFNGQPAFWTRLAEALGFPPTMSKDTLLDALAAAGNMSGRPLILCIDALNETNPRTYWHTWLSALVHEIEKRPALKLCVTCRTSFVATCLPAPHASQAIEHDGFAGIEREACNAFFAHYGLEAPLLPVLQPELANPLYLKLVCETLRLKGLRSLPQGWVGLAPVIRAFLAEKEQAFALEKGVAVGAGIVSGSLLAVASAIATAGGVSVTWSDAHAAITTRLPHASSLGVIEWLVHAELLLEDGPGNVIGGQSMLRPAFERFGDFLIASELLSNVAGENFSDAFRADKTLQSMCSAPQLHTGVLQALAVLVSERPGIELPYLVDQSVYKEVLKISIGALVWRDPATFTSATTALVEDSLFKNTWPTLDALIAVSTHTSSIDAHWLTSFLNRLGLVNRDSVLAPYLHQARNKTGIARRLITASDDINLEKIDEATAERWIIVLVWFTASADRRIKDEATRAAVSLCRAKPLLAVTLVGTFLRHDDDEVRERMLLVVYTGLLLARDCAVLRAVSAELLGAYQATPDAFEHALIRDHIRCVAELARELGCLDAGLDPELPTKPRASGWQIVLPTDAQMSAREKQSKAMALVIRSATHDDFNHYTIRCLSPWMNKHMNADAICKWVIAHVAEELELASTTNCDPFDVSIAHKDGGGRSKPAWAERVGKKYQWIALFRLSSKLHDHFEREKDSWTPAPQRTPLILQEERKLDPTLTRPTEPERAAKDCWWLPSEMDLTPTQSMDIHQWQQRTDDVVTLEKLLGPTTHDGQRWVPLTMNVQLSEYSDERPAGQPYRSQWHWVQAFLVSIDTFDRTIAALDGRNFFGGWLPDGGKWLHTFVGEYPWATACNTEPDSYLGVDRGVRDTALKFQCATNQVVAEWEYDATLSSSIYVQVPAKQLAARHHWNGTNAFLEQTGRIVYLAPTIGHGGPSTLLADVDALLPILDRLGFRLFWTLMGHKNLLGDSATRTADNCWSQLAILELDGKITIRPVAFFDDEQRSAGPRNL